GVDIPGATNSLLILSTVSSNDIRNYSVVISNAYGVTVSSNANLSLRASLLIGWGQNTFGQANTPSGVSNVLLFAGGFYYSMAENSDGSTIFWGSSPAIAGSWPLSTGFVAIAAGLYYALGIREDGTLVSTSSGWGIPPGMSNVVGAAVGETSGLAVRSDG